MLKKKKRDQNKYLVHVKPQFCLIDLFSPIFFLLCRRHLMKIKGVNDQYWWLPFKHSKHANFYGIIFNL